MDSKYGSMVVAVVVGMMSLLSGCVKSDLAKDKEECADQLVGLATCLPYVGGNAKTPTIDCCTGLGQVLSKSKKCLCILVRDRNDPNLGLKINATLALSLPSQCHTPANISECPALLHLAPNSPDAKVFEDFAKNDRESSTAEATPATGASKDKGSSAAADIKNDGGKAKSRLGLGEMALGVIITAGLHLLLRPDAAS